MAKDQTSDAKAKKPDPSALNIDKRYITDDDALRLRDASAEEFEAWQTELAARVMTMPETRSAAIIQRFQGKVVDINATADELRRLIADVHKGDMKNPEAMLVTQAQALDALFSILALRSHSNMIEGYGDAADRYMRLALRAQSQTVKTIEALAELKNPRPIAFVRQANIANGPQQVNNGSSFETSTPAHARTQENQNQQNELLEVKPNELLDTRAPSAPGRADQAMATVEQVDGAAYS